MKLEALCRWMFAGLLLAGVLAVPVQGAEPPAADAGATMAFREIGPDGTPPPGAAELTLHATFGQRPGAETAWVVSAVHHEVRLDGAQLRHAFKVDAEAIRGVLREVVLAVGGDGEFRTVTGDGLESWSERRSAEGRRQLVLLLKAEVPTDGAKPAPRRKFSGVVTAETRIPTRPSEVASLTLTSEPAALGQGTIRVISEGAWNLEVAAGATGLMPVESPRGEERVRIFRYHGEGYTLPLRVVAADPEAGQVVLTRFGLKGQLSAASASFVLEADVRVSDPAGGSLELLSGKVALAEPVAGPGWSLTYTNDRYVARFAAEGAFRMRVPFQAAVTPSNGWSRTEFRVATAALSPVVLTGLPAEAQITAEEAAPPTRGAEGWTTHLPGSGSVRLAWRQAPPETEGRLFFAAEALMHVAISPGLLRETILLETRIQQGEMDQLVLRLTGEGEIVRVQGPQVLAWSVVANAGDATRRLVVSFNQPQRERSSVQVQLQRPLGAFPLGLEVPLLQPEGAARFSGHLRLVNDGAVRLEVLESVGLSQISPEQLPRNEAFAGLLPRPASQTFAFRVAGPAVRFRVQADNILPELSVSQVLLYHLGETELTLDADFEIDVREAPLRELQLRVPRGFALARLQAPGMSDYFLTEPPGDGPAELRVVYTNPVQGPQSLQLRLERNQPLTGSRWDLPRVDVERARSVRGSLGVSADAGFRLTAAPAGGVSEIAAAFFPRKVAGLQVALRLTEPQWAAGVLVERLAQSIQADVLHLFSVGEGIAYGSSLMNYSVSGAPVGILRVELSPEYFNVEFTGQNIRSWQKTDTGYEIQLHTPVTGAYALLATYERPFQARGETLSFAGARPVDAQTEQGYTLVVSTFQLEVRPVSVSDSLLRLETGEVPPEYRLFFDAPILAAYRYVARPFNLQLELTPLRQGEVVSQVIDRAALMTRISDEGQVVTEGRYFLKSKGAPHLRLRLPEGAELWSVTVDGKTVVPVKSGSDNLVPLPAKADPDVVSEVTVKMATRSPRPSPLVLEAPRVGAPVLLGEWRLEPAARHQLLYRGGTLTPADGIPDHSGFAALMRLFEPGRRTEFARLLVNLAASVVLALAAWGGLAMRGRRFGLRHLLAGLLGVAAFIASAATLLRALEAVDGMPVAVAPSHGLRFVAPIQISDAEWTVRVANVEVGDASGPGWGFLLLGALAVAAWGAAWLRGSGWGRRPLVALGWTLLLWGALRAEDGFRWFILFLGLLLALHLFLPGLIRWWRRPAEGVTPGAAAATAAVLALFSLAVPRESRAAAPTEASLRPLDAVVHRLEVRDGQVRGQASVRWEAKAGEWLTLFREPGVLTQATLPEGRARLVPVTREGRREQVLVASTNGLLEFTLDYQAKVIPRGEELGFVLPVVSGLATRVVLRVADREVEVASPQAVSRDVQIAGGGSVATLVLAPAAEVWIGWKPRARDTRAEKAVLYAEWVHLLAPVPGLVEGLHQAQIRPAQGEVSELSFLVPDGATISDVEAPGLSAWRFDPDTRRLRLTLAAQSRPFAVSIRSQVATGALPYEARVGVPSLESAAGEVGLIGLGTGSEVQLAQTTAERGSVINLEDFPPAPVQALAAQIPDLAVRRALRYAQDAGIVVLQAVAVEADVRVESQQTLSLGEDRVLLAAELNVEVIRAGIFRLSFPLPAGLEVESASGPMVSHWTELSGETGRTVTLHLKGKTQGQQTLHLTLAGPGVRSTNGWVVPRIRLQEASKQRGQLVVVPEQGLRLQVAQREGVTQLDPVTAGIQQKGVLAFRLLQDQWTLALDLEQVDAWIQVTSLQHASLSESQVRVTANLQYEVENTGVKGLSLRLPAAAENVRVTGEQVVDFAAATAAPGAASRDWEVKLGRRIMGRHLFQVTYTLALAAQATEAVIEGVRALEVNLQRGFVTVQAGGRLQIQATPTPALQAAEWQMIPRTLLQGIPAAQASVTYRIVEPEFRLPVQLTRHEAARLLPARVRSVELTSVISDDATQLTRVRVELIPGDKRLLHIGLPAGTQFWFGFVNQNSVWPWLSTNEVLLPIDSGAAVGEVTSIEYFYSGRAGEAERRDLEVDLRAPRMDLPLENITWTLFLHEKWTVKRWSGAFQLSATPDVEVPTVLDLDRYLASESEVRVAKTREAEEFLGQGNQLMLQGDQQQARRAFQAAYGASQHDRAFNEDARVQLNNLRVQNALVGLNVRQSRMGENAQVPLRSAPGAEFLNFTPAEARQLLDRNSAEENAVQTKLAERLIQQQDAAAANPAAIRAALPTQGRRLTFTRPLEINRSSELALRLEARTGRTVSWGWRAGVVGALFAAVLVLLLVRPRATAA